MVNRLMFPSKIRCFILCFFCVLVAEPTSLRGGSRFNDEQFLELPPEVQKTLIEDAFKSRLDALKNVKYEAVQSFFNAQVDELLYEYDSSLKDESGLGGTVKYLHLRIGDSYRMEITKTWTNQRSPEQKVVNWFDSNEGVNRGYISQGNLPGVFEGRIATEQDSLTDENRFMYWLDGQNTKLGEYLFPCLLANLSEATIARSEIEGCISFAHAWSRSESSIGKRIVDLDLSKDFLPIRSRGERTSVRSGKITWFQAFDVLESKKVEDLWMPVHVREISSTNVTEAKHKAAIDDYRVTSISIGEIMDEDLKLEFPNSTLVVDSIRGVYFRAGRHGAENGLFALGAPVETTKNLKKSNSLPYSVLVGFILIMTALILKRVFGTGRCGFESKTL